jgi:CheY-like chemotaxis protein
VDDNVDSAQSLAMLLEVSGHLAWMAHDGAAALDAAREYRPQVVFLDIGLPKIDGYEVAKRLRDDPAIRDIVIVAMTGYGQAADRERARAVGFDHHLVKPVDYANVERVLKGIPQTPLG